MPFCNSCGADVAGVKFCSKCGQPVEDASATASEAPGATAAAPPPAAAAAPIANDNVLGAAAYVTIIPAIIFLLLEPYNKNKFVRFHSLQCLLLAGSLIVINTANIILGLMLGSVPIVGGILSVGLSFAIMIGGLAAWLIAVIKAYNGEEFRLPVIGNIAAQHA
jgi:uncharacterized membrane protein